MGGHAAIRATLHDGIKLPRAYRAAGLKTDLFDATDLATCRMYRSAADLWHGLAKNATEALAAPALIVPATLLLLGGQVLPLLLVLFGPALGLSAADRAVAAVAPGLLVPAAAGRRRPVPPAAPRGGAAPVGVLILLAIQWYALGRDLLGRPATWKGRPYPRGGQSGSTLSAANRPRHRP